MANGLINLDSFRLGVSVTTLLTVIGAAFGGGMFIKDFQNRFEALETGQVTLEAQIVRQAPENYNRRDMEEWCGSAERQNNAFDCPNPYELPGYRHFRRNGMRR